MRYDPIESEIRLAQSNDLQIPQLQCLFDKLDIYSRYSDMIELIIRYPGYICPHYQKNPSKYNIAKAHSIGNFESTLKKTMMIQHDLCIALSYYDKYELTKLIKQKIFNDPNVIFKIQLEILAKSLNIFDKNL